MNAGSTAGRAAAATAALAGALLWAGEARAFERQWRVGGGVGVAHLAGSTAGPAIDVHAAYGLTDMFDVHLQTLGSRHFSGTGTNVLSASAGLSYKIDVLQWVPYIGLFGGYYLFDGQSGPNGESGSEAGASVGAGLDYLWTRGLSVGLQARQHASFADGVSFPYFDAVLRAEHRWGF